MRDIPVNRSATDSMRQSNLMLSPRHNPIRSGSSCRSPYASAYLPLLNKHEAPATPGIRDLNQTLVADYKREVSKRSRTVIDMRTRIGSPYASAYLPLLNKHEAPATPGIRDLNQTL